MFLHINKVIYKGNVSRHSQMKIIGLMLMMYLIGISTLYFWIKCDLIKVTSHFKKKNQDQSYFDHKLAATRTATLITLG